MSGSIATMHPVPGAAKAGDRAGRVRVVALAVLLALLPVRLTLPTANAPYVAGPVYAFADGGEGESDGGGEGESDGGGEGESGGDGGGGDGGNSGSGGSDDGGDDGGDDNDDHGATGSSLGGFLGALMSHGRVSSAQVSSETISVVYSDGWTEQVSKGRYQLLDRKHRVVISRKARPLDLKRLRAAAGR